MEDITLALITLTSFVLLFVVAIFADRAGMQADDSVNSEPLLVPVDEALGAKVATDGPRIDADVA